MTKLDEKKRNNKKKDREINIFALDLNLRASFQDGGDEDFLRMFEHQVRHNVGFAALRCKFMTACFKKINWNFNSE